MTTYNASKNTSSQFTVNKKQVSKNKTLKTSVLYHKIEASAHSSLTLYQNSSSINFNSIAFDILENAYLNDQLIIKNDLKQLSATEVILKITVSKKEKKQDIICKAVFGYSLQKAS